MASTVAVQGGRDAFRVTVSGDVAGRLNARTLQQCLNVVMACAERNHPAAHAFGINAACIGTLAEQIVKEGCAAEGFGLAASGVTVAVAHDKIEVNFHGAAARRLNPAVVEGCAKALVECADQHHPAHEAFAINEKCVSTLLAHANQAHCISQGFGLVPAKG